MQELFDQLLASETPLDGLDAVIWQELETAANTQGHPWNLGTVATVGAHGSQAPLPHCRTVVLRQVDRAQRSIDFYTDARSEKIRQMQSGQTPAPVCWLMYDPQSKIQLRMDGTADIINTDETDHAWQATPLHARAAYLSLATPGKPAAGASPPDTNDRFPEAEASERGRRDFRIVRTRVQRIDWLYLRRAGHVRALIDDSDPKQTRYWVVP